MKNKGINLRKVDKMEGLAFKNCLRLHFDSVLLFKHRSYPSAFFLSVLALEELGKVFILSEFLFQSRFNGRFNLINDKELKKEYGEDLEEAYLHSIYSHCQKQRMFVHNVDIIHPSNKFLKKILDGNLEQMKQNSAYVGFSKKIKKIELKGKIKHPFNVNKEKTLRQITHMQDYLSKLVARALIEESFLDSEMMESLITKRLFKKLNVAWKFQGREIKARLGEWRRKYADSLY
jgi:AbiV family abortive infection protein